MSNPYQTTLVVTQGMHLHKRITVEFTGNCITAGKSVCSMHFRKSDSLNELHRWTLIMEIGLCCYDT